MAELHSKETDQYIENYEKQLLLFKINNNYFGADVKQITEVIEMIDIIHIPHMNDSVPGIINLRGAIIPVVDLNHHLFSTKSKFNNKTRLIIFYIEEKGNDSLIGGIVDSVDDVINLSNEHIQPAPDFGSNIKKEYIDSATKYMDSIIMILNIDNILTNKELHFLKDSDIDTQFIDSFNENSDFNIETSKEFTETENEIEYVTFMIDEDLYGIKTMSIKEIIGIDSFRKIPNSLPFLKGVVNLREEIIPIVDMRARCGLPEKEYNKKTSILIITLNEKNIGLIVEKMDDVMKFGERQIKDIPHYSANIDRDFIDSMSEIDGKIIIFLNINKILSPDEFDKLSDLEV